MYTMSLPSGTLRKDGVVVIMDDRNPEYVVYALWLAAGNGPTEIVDQEVVAVRQHITVSAVQLRRALNQESKRDALELAVANSDIAIRDGWQYLTEWESDNPQLPTMLPGLDISEDEMYNLFSLAKTL